MVKEITQGNMVLGSFITWLVVRIAALALLAFSLYSAPSLDISIDSGFKIVLVLALLFLSNQVTYGTTDAHGMHYRRYFRSVFVPWHAIVSISQNLHVALSIVVERRSVFTRRLVFLAAPNPSTIGRLPVAFHKLRNIWLEGRRI